MYQNFRSIQENIMLIEGALHGDFVIPEFGQFTKHLEEIYHHCKENAEGKVGITGKNNRFPFLDILGYLKNTHKNPKFGTVREVPIRELGWEFPGWDLSHFAKFGIFMGIP